MQATFLNRLAGTHLDEPIEETVLQNLRGLLNALAPFEHVEVNRQQSLSYLTSTLNYGLPDVLWQSDSAGDAQHRARMKRNILSAIRAFEPRLQAPELEWSNTQDEEVLSFLLTGHVESATHSNAPGTEKARLVARVWCDANGRFDLK